jgi:formylglycine-generating enzyme required for sulfatase activity
MKQFNQIRKGVLSKMIALTIQSRSFVLMLIILLLSVSSQSKSSGKPDTKPPKIKLLTPKDGRTATGPVKIAASARDKHGILKVGFFVDGELIREVYNPPYECILNAGFWADGKAHKIKAIATDNYENSAVSKEIRINIPGSAFVSPDLIYPKNKTTTRSRSKIFMKWTSLYGASDYIVAIAKDRDFKNIVVSYTVTDTALITEPLPIGQYYWAVAAKNPIGKWSQWSKFHEFYIKPPMIPKLIEPKNNFYFKSTEAPCLSWNKSKYASEYEVKVIKVTNPEITEFTNIISDTFIVVSGLPEGWHQWSVRSRNSDGIYSKWSKARQFYTSSPEITQFVKVAAGEYTSGKNNIIRQINYDYEIMKYPVTCRQYLNFMNQAFCRNAIDENGYGHYDGDKFTPAGEYKFIDVKEKQKEIGNIFFDPENKYFVLESAKYMDHPIGNVSWFGAHAFAKWYGLALPTEEEWEKAARGLTGFDFPWGNTIDCQNANIAGCMERGFSASTTPVGKFNGTNNTIDSPSPYGAYDMAGNVWEWTESWFGGNFRTYRVIKGGSYHESKGIKANLESLSTWYRYWMAPQSTTGKYGSAVGFRCVLKNE